jgi:hypothetical protein
MKTTKVESFAVVSIAWRMSLKERRLARDRHEERARGAHGAAFGGRRPSEEDRAEHEEDEAERRDQHEDDLLGELREKPELERAVHQARCQREHGAGAGREDEALVEHRLGIRRHVVEPVEEDRERRGEEKEHADRRGAAAAVRLAELARLGRERGHPGRA